MILDGENRPLSIKNPDTNRTARFVIAAGEPLNKPFYKLIGLGGFIIGESEAQVRQNMQNFSVQAEQIKTQVPHYFPKQYL